MNISFKSTEVKNSHTYISNSAMAQSQPRLDKNHGFLHHITRNQIDRRDYHEEKLKVGHFTEILVKCKGSNSGTIYGTPPC